MSIPIKHHFLPQFYLERWATPASAGKVVAFRRPLKDLVISTHHPAGIAYKEHLYAVPSREDPIERQTMESRFMAPLDSRAAKALTFLEQEKRRPNDPGLVSAWSRFVMSQLYRSPERVAWLKARILEKDAGTEASLRQAYDALRGDGDPPTLDEYREARRSALDEEAQVLLLRKMIDNRRIGEHLNNMLWFHIIVPEDGHGVLTSDSPVMMSNGISHWDSFVLLPTGRSTLFLATNQRLVADAFLRQPAKLFVRAMNDAIVRQADKLVIGHTNRHRAFVYKRLGRGGPSSDVGFFRRMVWQAPIGLA